MGTLLILFIILTAIHTVNTVTHILQTTTLFDQVYKTFGPRAHRKARSYILLTFACEPALYFPIKPYTLSLNIISNAIFITLLFYLYRETTELYLLHNGHHTFQYCCVSTYNHAFSILQYKMHVLNTPYSTFNS